MKKKILVFLIAICILILTACSPNMEDSLTVIRIDDNYRTYYEIFVHSFADSNGDGIGDFKGLTNKLDYVNDGNDKTSDDLGVTGIWLMPIMPSPTYHKYDATDYYNIDSAYGDMKDFDEFIKECKARNIKVIIDLVLNHTSSDHPWFKEAVSAINSGDLDNKYIKYYNFTREAQVGYSNKGLPSGWYYECVFWDGMPDLNLDNSDVLNEIKNIMKFWLDKGVGGFRLDAVKHFFNGSVKNVEFMRTLTDYAKSVKEDAYLIGEAWDTSLVIKDFYSSGMDSFFNYPYGDSDGVIKQSITSKNVEGFIKSLSAWNKEIKEINPSAIDSLFLSNHDNGRSAGFFSEQQRFLAASLYLLSPGTPYIYYGEEIGIKGSGKDENKRLAMIWGEDTTLKDPPNSNYDKEYQVKEGVKQQLENADSLLKHYIRLIKIRNANPVIARGDMSPLVLNETNVGGYKITFEGETNLVLHNFSDMEKSITFDFSLKKLNGYVSLSKNSVKISKNMVKMPPLSSAVIHI